jgi:hypothetical protein
VVVDDHLGHAYSQNQSGATAGGEEGRSIRRRCVARSPRIDSPFTHCLKITILYCLQFVSAVKPEWSL